MHLFRSPDIRTIGIELDVPKGLVVKQTTGPAEAAGMKAGDRIAKVEGDIVWTFADLQHRYDKVPRASKTVTMTVEREGGAQDLKIPLPVRWWWTDTRYRQSSIEPRSYFDDRALTAEEKAKLGLPADGFASQVKYVSSMAYSVQAHDLKVHNHHRHRWQTTRRTRRYGVSLYRPPQNAWRYRYAGSVAGWQEDHHAAEDDSDEFSEMKPILLVMAALVLPAAEWSKPAEFWWTTPSAPPTGRVSTPAGIWRSN